VITDKPPRALAFDEANAPNRETPAVAARDPAAFEEERGPENTDRASERRAIAELMERTLGDRDLDKWVKC
jgi:hypothetical protein